METSGALPMCGHGTIGMITFGIEHGLIEPRVPGALRVEVPAGVLDISYRTEGDRVVAVRIRNVASFMVAEGLAVEVPGLGPLVVDIAYGGNFNAIVEPQGAYPGLDAMSAAQLIEYGQAIRAILRDRIDPVHPLDPTIRGVTHVLWADRARDPNAHGRNAVFYGERAIDRSPCGTGTSARLAQLVHHGRLRPGDSFVHESYIGSLFEGRVEAATTVAGIPAIIPSIEGQAVATGFNIIQVDRQDKFWEGFTVT